MGNGKDIGNENIVNQSTADFDKLHRNHNDCRHHFDGHAAPFIFHQPAGSVNL